MVNLEINKIYNLDCLDGLKLLPDNSVDLIITSPPYKDVDGFSEDFIQQVFVELFSVCKNNSLFFLNFGHLAEDKFRPFKVCQLALNCGFELNDTIIWLKNHYKPIQGSGRLNNLTEFIFLLHKGKMPNIDRLSIGIPYADKSNVKRFAGGKDLKCRGNLWAIPYPTIQSSQEKLHNDYFPVDLPKMCVKLSGVDDNALILDPFMGSGTTAVAAKSLGKNFIGFEKNEMYYQKAIERISN